MTEAHAYNHSYSRGRDQDVPGLKPAGANSCLDSILKIHNTKKGWQNGSSGKAPTYLSVGPEFKPQYHQKKKKSF
jgi:hypothetical protein